MLRTGSGAGQAQDRLRTQHSTQDKLRTSSGRSTVLRRRTGSGQAQAQDRLRTVMILGTRFFLLDNTGLSDFL